MDADRRRQNDLSRANIVRAQVLFLCSTLNEENLEDKLMELKKVKQSSPSFPSQYAYSGDVLSFLLFEALDAKNVL